MAQEGTAIARDTFTTQAASYAASTVVADRERRRQFVARVAPAPDARVLDVATGPGFTALAFAERTGFVLGLDLTPAMLVQARQARDTAGAVGLQFVLGDASALPVASGAFDVVGCSNAVHHFAAPLPPLRELCRACRPGGLVAISDLTTDEDPQRAATHNAIERLRDSSHVCCYPPSELAALLTSLGLVVRSVETTTRRRGLDEWLAIAKTSPERAAAVREQLLASLDDDRTGLVPAWEDGQLRFTHTTAWLIAARPEAA